MKKKLVSVFLAASMVATMMAGCGSKAPAANENAGTENGEGVAATTDDAIANLIAATDKTVELTLWCNETDAYQTVIRELVDEFEATYSEVDFNITIGVESEANCKDDVLADVEAAADVFVFPDDQLVDLVNAGALQSIDATYTYDPAKTNAATTVEAATVNGKLYAYYSLAYHGKSFLHAISMV